MRDARENGGIVNLIAVELQDRQHRAVPDRVEELVGMPCRSQRAGFGFPITNHYGDQEVGIVVRGAKSVRDAVAQLTALMNRTRSFRRAMTANAAGEGKLLEELAHPGFILAFVWVNLRIGTLEISRREHAWSAVARPGHKDRA